MKLNNVASRRAFLEQMPTQELDEMLQAELRKDNIDEDLVRLILDVLEKREADHPIENDEEIAAAVEKYTAYVDSLEATPAKPTRKWNAVLKVASVLLVVGLLFCIVPQAANAESFFELLARWTDSVFEFFNPGDDNKQPEYVFETDNPDLQKIYDAVLELGVTAPVVPMWVPEGYTLKDINVFELPTDTTLCASMIKDDDSLYFSIVAQNEVAPFHYPKDAQEVICFESNGVKHYIITNIDNLNATWISDNVECFVVTDCQEEELYKILRSIYATED